MRWGTVISSTDGTASNLCSAPHVCIGDNRMNFEGTYEVKAPRTKVWEFIIDPNKKIRLMLTYPAPTGRNFNEILRVLDALQLTDKHSVATPVNWKQGDDCVILPSITDPAVLKEKFPKGYKELRPYLRMTPQPNK